MAKAKLPLMGVEARGQLAKAIVFFPWKGIQAVRTHVYPSQPRTAAQIALRNDFKSHVDAWHDALMLAVDKAAWNLYAGVTKRAASGFNEFLSFFRKFYDPADNKDYVRSMAVSGNTGGNMTLNMNCSDDTPRNVTVYYGYSKTFMPYTATAARVAPNDWQATLAGLTVGAFLYFYAIDEVATYYGRTGIYKEEVLP